MTHCCKTNYLKDASDGEWEEEIGFSADHLVKVQDGHQEEQYDEDDGSCYARIVAIELVFLVLRVGHLDAGELWLLIKSFQNQSLHNGRWWSLCVECRREGACCEISLAKGEDEVDWMILVFDGRGLRLYELA